MPERVTVLPISYLGTADPLKTHLSLLPSATIKQQGWDLPSRLKKKNFLKGHKIRNNSFQMRPGQGSDAKRKIDGSLRRSIKLINL